MAEDIDVLINRLKAAKNGLLQDAIDVAKELALSHKAIVVNRIQSEGIPGEKYSENGIPLSFVEDNPYARLNSGFDKLVKDKKKSGDLVAWKDVRFYQGLQTSFVDYTFSGRTLKNLTIVNTIISGDSAIAELGGSEQEAKERLSYGFDRYGDFLAPNEQEKSLLLTATEELFKQKLDKYNLV